MDVDTEDILSDLTGPDEDPIMQYFQSLFAKTEAESKKLQAQISDAQKLLAECLNAASQSGNLEVVEYWKKIHNNLYVFGLHLRKCSEVEFLMIENVILNWSSGFSPTYKTRIFEINQVNTLIFLNEYPIESFTIKNESIILIIVKVPDFCHRLSFNSEGIMLYKTNTSEEIQQINLPNLNMNHKDINDASLKIRSDDILTYKDTKSILTYLVCNEEFDLVAKVNDGQNLARQIYVQCGYEEVNLNSDKKLFLINNSDNTNGSFIEIIEGDVSDIFKIKIICSNEDVLFKILHTIYEKIQGICVLPTSHEVYLHHLKNSQDDADENKEKFARALRKQLDLFRDFCKNEVRECGRENYLKFRSKLNELQLETDVLYTKICNYV